MVNLSSDPGDPELGSVDPTSEVIEAQASRSGENQNGG